MSKDNELPDAEDILAAQRLSQAQADLKLAMHIADVRRALNVVETVSALLPEPARTLVHTVRALLSEIGI